MDTLPPSSVKEPMRDITLVQLAREIAIDHLNNEEILKLYSITQEEWEVIKSNKRFQTLLEQEILAWQSATNTAERTRLKAGAIIEHWMPEANMRLHSSDETLPAKVELAKMVSRIAGLDRVEGSSGPSGAGFSVTINLGGGDKVKFDALPTKVIDHDSN